MVMHHYNPSDDIRIAARHLRELSEALGKEDRSRFENIATDLQNCAFDVDDLVDDLLDETDKRDCSRSDPSKPLTSETLVELSRTGNLTDISEFIAETARHHGIDWLNRWLEPEGFRLSAVKNRAQAISVSHK